MLMSYLGFRIIKYNGSYLVVQYKKSEKEQNKKKVQPKFERPYSQQIMAQPTWCNGLKCSQDTSMGNNNLQIYNPLV